MIVFTAALVVWVLSGLALRVANSGKVLPGTSVAGLELGGSSREAVVDRLAGADPRRVTLRSRSRELTVSAPRAGFELDLDATAERALKAGRGGFGVGIFAGPMLLVGDRESPLIYESVDESKLQAAIKRIADRVDREPFLGALSVNPQSLVVRTKQPRAGLTVTRAPGRKALADAFRSDQDAIELPLRRLAAPDPAEVAKVGRKAESYLRSPLRIRTAGGPASFPPRRIARVLRIESASAGGKPTIRLGVDEEKVKSLVADLAERRFRPSKDARLDTPGSPPVTLSEQGDLTWTPKPDVATVRPSRSGRQIKVRQAEEAFAKAVRGGDHVARFATEKVPPEIKTKDVKGRNSLIGTFTTNYNCCEPRVTNIKRMATAVDGTVIGPGEQFSLNAIAGERTRDKGYRSAPSIAGENKLVDTVGGGVSQFSTTAYNAAYFAGVQIDTHTPHSFYISRYPPGREATLDFGSIELLWTNDTGSPIVVRSSASDTSVTVSLYGGNGGRRVRAISGPRKSVPGRDFDITVTRVIRYRDGEVKREGFTSSYAKPAS